MLLILWQFRANPARTADFRRTYSGQGEWAKLFSRDSDYRGTVLLQDTDDPLVFVVIDRWAKRDSFQSFRAQFGPEYEHLDEQCRELTDAETLLGIFTDEAM
jgi:antibiotic biosynthesis monooxygenase